MFRHPPRHCWSGVAPLLDPAYPHCNYLHHASLSFIPRFIQNRQFLVTADEVFARARQLRNRNPLFAIILLFVGCCAFSLWGADGEPMVSPSIASG